jgi:hypothetical protein
MSLQNKKFKMEKLQPNNGYDAAYSQWFQKRSMIKFRHVQAQHGMLYDQSNLFTRIANVS